MTENFDEIGTAIADAARVLVPIARMYLGPAVAVVSRGEREEGTDGRILMLALNKLVIEAGTLPAPGAAYAPHSTAFTIDAETKMGNALDLPFVLAALRGLGSWAGAAPPVAAARIANAPVAAVAPATSTRDMRMAARVREVHPSVAAIAPNVVVPSRRTGGCGCSGGASTSSATPAKRGVRKPDCRDPRPHCDCGMSCAGRGCGCNGRTSCTDCIPRGKPSADRCSCGTCVPPPESCEPWSPSCETRNRLRRCLKDILCDLLLCIERALCQDNRIDANRLELTRCLTDLFCRALRCIREALCPPPVVQPPALPPIPDCLPCSYAVEDPS